MDHNILRPDFFQRGVLQVAPELLGKILVRQSGDSFVRLTVNEVEAYDGAFDLACHASKGRTKRTEVMFWPGGHFYVYLCYGMYWMLNVVCDSRDYPSAILIRGAGHLDGPGKLTRDLKIDGRFNGRLVGADCGLWFEEPEIPVRPLDIERTERVGVGYAGPVWSQKKYRFILSHDERTRGKHR